MLDQMEDVHALNVVILAAGLSSFANTCRRRTMLYSELKISSYKTTKVCNIHYFFNQSFAFDQSFAMHLRHSSKKNA